MFWFSISELGLLLLCSQVGAEEDLSDIGYKIKWGCP